MSHLYLAYHTHKSILHLLDLLCHLLFLLTLLKGGWKTAFRCIRATSWVGVWIGTVVRSAVDERSGILLLLLRAPNLDLTMAKTFTITPLILILVFFDKNKLVLMPLQRILETSLTYAVLDIDAVMFVMTEED